MTIVDASASLSFITSDAGAGEASLSFVDPAFFTPGVVSGISAVILLSIAAIAFMSMDFVPQNNEDEESKDCGCIVLSLLSLLFVLLITFILIVILTPVIPAFAPIKEIFKYLINV